MSRLFLPLVTWISSAQHNRAAESFNHSLKQMEKLRQKYKLSREQTRLITCFKKKEKFRRRADFFFLRIKVVSCSSVVPELGLRDVYVRRQMGCFQEVETA